MYHKRLGESWLCCVCDSKPPTAPARRHIKPTCFKVSYICETRRPAHIWPCTYVLVNSSRVCLIITGRSRLSPPSPKRLNVTLYLTCHRWLPLLSYWHRAFRKPSVSLPGRLHFLLDCLAFYAYRTRTPQQSAALITHLPNRSVAFCKTAPWLHAPVSAHGSTKNSA